MKGASPGGRQKSQAEKQPMNGKLPLWLYILGQICFCRHRIEHRPNSVASQGFKEKFVPGIRQFRLEPLTRFVGWFLQAPFKRVGVMRCRLFGDFENLGGQLMKPGLHRRVLRPIVFGASACAPGSFLVVLSAEIEKKQVDPQEDEHPKEHPSVGAGKKKHEDQQANPQSDE